MTATTTPPIGTGDESVSSDSLTSTIQGARILQAGWRWALWVCALTVDIETPSPSQVSRESTPQKWSCN